MTTPLFVSLVKKMRSLQKQGGASDYELWQAETEVDKAIKEFEKGGN